jgi:large subunit ribosomal protein L21
MTYAIIETGGKQLRVEPGRFYDIESLPVDEDEQVTIEKVLLVQHDGEAHIGQPLVEGATVEGTVVRHFRDRKVIV